MNFEAILERGHHQLLLHDLQAKDALLHLSNALRPFGAGMPPSTSSTSAISFLISSFRNSHASIFDAEPDGALSALPGDRVLHHVRPMQLHPAAVARRHQRTAFLGQPVDALDDGDLISSIGGGALLICGSSPWAAAISRRVRSSASPTLSNVYPPQPGAYRVIPWIVLAWCCVPLIATLLHPRLLDLVTSGCLAVGARMKQD